MKKQRNEEGERGQFQRLQMKEFHVDLNCLFEINTRHSHHRHNVKEEVGNEQGLNQLENYSGQYLGDRPLI